MLSQDPNYSASYVLLHLFMIILCNATFCNLFGEKVFRVEPSLNNIIYSNRRVKMDFTLIVGIALVAVVAWTLIKAFSKKETVVEAVKEEVAEVKVAVAEVAKVAKKPTVKKATTQAAKKPAAKKASTKAKKATK